MLFSSKLMDQFKGRLTTESVLVYKEFEEGRIPLLFVDKAGGWARLGRNDD